MRNYQRIGLGFLVGLVFASGYAARMRCNAAEARARAAQQISILVPGTRVAAASLESAANVDFKPLETLIFVVNSLRQHFVEQITDDTESRMTHDALKGMLARLDDTNTRFMNADQKKIVESAADGTFHGIGAILSVKRFKTGTITDEHLIVVTPLKSGPADEAALQPGDEITAVDGKSVLPFNPFQKASQLAKTEENRKAWSPPLKAKMKAEEERIKNGIPILEAENRLMSEDKGEFELTIARKNAAAPIKVKLTAREFKVEPVASSTLDDGKLGYLRINCITPDAGDRVAGALAKLRDDGVKGLVLDLRGSVGGNIEPMANVAANFAAGKKLATLLRSHGRKSDIVAPKDDEQGWRKPIVVLVDRGTTRTPEILAAALKNVCGARLVGEKTCGDFNHVTMVEEPDGTAISFTSGVFLTTSGDNFNNKGLPVDVQVAASATGDPQVKEAIRLLTTGDHRS
jgi:carboxyl-terminal processing protease